MFCVGYGIYTREHSNTAVYMYIVTKQTGLYITRLKALNTAIHFSLDVLLWGSLLSIPCMLGKFTAHFFKSPF